MADLSKLKRRLPPPPTEEEASTTLQEPETAPAPAPPPKASTKKIDGRTLRKTGRTVQFATRVNEDFDRRFRQIAKRDGVLFAQLLELSLEAYEDKRKN
jgi:hypothetical protein